MNFIAKAILKKQLKGTVPDEQIDMIITAVEKNPDFFKKIAEKTKAKMDAGMSQQDAAMAVMAEHADEIKGIMGK
jgi:hypothetical protein